MSNIILIVPTVVGGAAIALQPSINARLAEKTGFLEAATVSFPVGTLVLLLILLASRQGFFLSFAASTWLALARIHSKITVPFVFLYVSIW